MEALLRELWLLVGELWRKPIQFLPATQCLLDLSVHFKGFILSFSHLTGSLMLMIMLPDELVSLETQVPQGQHTHNSALIAFLPKSSPWPDFSFPASDITTYLIIQTRSRAYALWNPSVSPTLQVSVWNLSMLDAHPKFLFCTTVPHPACPHTPVSCSRWTNALSSCLHWHPKGPFLGHFPIHIFCHCHFLPES